MPELHAKDVKELKENIAMYFDRLSLSLRCNTRDQDYMDCMCDLFTGMIGDFFYSLPDINGNRLAFLANIEHVVTNIMMHDTKERAA